MFAATEGQRAERVDELESLSLDAALESLNVGQKLREQRTQKRSREERYAEPADLSRALAMRDDANMQLVAAATATAVSGPFTRTTRRVRKETFH